MCRTERPPKVFISYSHDDDAHKARVLRLADQLRVEGGIKSIIDRYVEPYPELGWAAWCWRQIEEADFIIMVCTAAYNRRVSHKEEAGKGHGVCWEAPLIFQLLYEQGSTGRKFVPCLLNGGIADDIPLPVRKFGHFRVEDDDGWCRLLQHLLGERPVPAPEIGSRPALPREPRSEYSSRPIPTPVAPPTQAGRLFVGRHEELATLRTLLLNSRRERLPVVVSGMPGVGKSYLVDRFYTEHRQDFPGGYVRRSFDAEEPVTIADLLAQIAGQLRLPENDPAVLAVRLADPLTLLHMENVDSPAAGRIAGALANALPGCALIFSARLRGLGTAGGWGQVALEPFAEDDALSQLRAELGEQAPHQEAWPGLATALGRLPLALHLASGHLRAGDPPAIFLRRLRVTRLALDYADAADPVFRQPNRALLNDTFDLSIDLLRRKGGDAWANGLLALGWGAAAGFGESLGAAIAGLDAEAFDEMARAASRLSLLERRSDGNGVTLRLHPLLAELGRASADKEATIARMTGWFCERLPAPAAGAESRWNEVQAETAALLEWLPLVPPDDRVRIVQAGASMAIRTGLFDAWRRFGEAALAGAADGAERSSVLWMLGNVALRGGDPDAALRWAEEMRELDLARSADREAASAAGVIAEILQARGELDEALRIRREEQLPVYARLGDVRLRAVTMGQIADILYQRGELDEALRIYREELLSTFERLGDVHPRAVTMGKIADILEARGELDEALRIRGKEELPMYVRLGDVHSRAVTMGKIADILYQRGELDEALRIHREEQLPVYERLGDVRLRAVTRGQIADILYLRGELDDALRIYREELLSTFERLGDVRLCAVTKGKIGDILYQRGELDEALRIRREEQLPVYERLGDVRLRAVTMGQIADILYQRGEPDEALRIYCEELLSTFERLGDLRERAVTMGKIAGILQARGELDEALRICREEQLPLFERLGDVRSLLIGRTNMAQMLLSHNKDGNRQEAQRLLCLALADARRLRIPEEGKIEETLQSHGLSCG